MADEYLQLKSTAEEIDNTVSSIPDIQADIMTNASAIMTNQANIEMNSQKIATNTEAIEVLNGTGEGSVEKTVTDKIAEVVNDAPEEFNTLKEMSDWLTEHEDSAATMNTAIQKNTADIATNTANIAENAERSAINRTTLGYQGKNLLNVTASSQTINGITFTVNDDKSITATGTATANAIFKFYTGKLPAGQYKYSGLNVTPTASTANMSVFNATNWTSIVSLNSNDEFTLTAETTVECRAVIYSGYTADNVVFYPMLRYAEITDDTYEPYAASVDERLAAVENSVEITKPTLTVNSAYIASSRLYCHKVGKLVFIQGTITTAAEVPAWTTSLISGLPTTSQAYYFRIVRTGTTASTPTVYLNNGGTTINVENNALTAEATYYINFNYIEN